MINRLPKILPEEITDKYQIIRNSFITKDNGEKANELKVIVGDDKQDDFYPQVKIERWENETNFSVRLIDNDKTTSKIKTDGNKIKFIKNKVEAHFYDCKVDNKEKSDGFEFEVILKEKPVTNKIQMSIRTKGLKFYYQPELTQQEKDSGAFRPENVVGSYAVYHESKKGDYHLMGGKNYKTGKAFHIYRPKITDAEGNWVWGRLNIDEKKKLLTVEIPQKFLDKAVYPVIIDPTFGYETLGGTDSPILASVDLWGTSHTCPANCTAQKITIGYGGGVSGKYVKGVIVLCSNKNIITNGISNPGPISSSSNTWTDVEFETDPSLSENTDYYLMAIANGGFHLCYDDGPTNCELRDTSNDYSSPTDPTDGSSYDRKYSIYCTYTADETTEKQITDNGSGADSVSVKNKISVSDENMPGVSVF